MHPVGGTMKNPAQGILIPRLQTAVEKAKVLGGNDLTGYAVAKFSGSPNRSAHTPKMGTGESLCLFQGFPYMAADRLGFCFRGKKSGDSDSDPIGRLTPEWIEPSL